MNNYVGIGVSPGFAIGKALLLSREALIIPSDEIRAGNIPVELKKFEDAIVTTKKQVNAIKAKTREIMGDDKAAIFDAQLEVLDDYVLLDAVRNKIKNDLKNASLALDEAAQEIQAMFDGIDDEYLRERVNDIRDICERIARNLLNKKIVDLSCLPNEAIIVANDLYTSDTATMDLGKVQALVLEVGGRTSHVSIMARNQEIPAVVGLPEITEKVTDGDLIIVDGKEGTFIVNPDAETLNSYNAKLTAYREQAAFFDELKDLPAQTLDGRTVELVGNIGGIQDIPKLFKYGTHSVGLFRTEFLYMDNKQLPSEQEQFFVYKAIVESMSGNPVIIRTLDIGGDKSLPYLPFASELNPYLGWRAIRICLDRTDIFKTQLTAILRASAYGNVKIIFPLIISIEEFFRAKALLKECMDELEKAGTDFNKYIDVGIMVETPAAVVLIDHFADLVDFFSIGTNDLTQYILAVDRGNEKIAHLYNSFHPAVISSIKKAIDASHKVGKWTGLCGEFAGDEKAALLLLGMGLDEFSMSSISIPLIKRIIRSVSFSAVEAMAEKALAQKTTEDVIKVVTDFYDNMKLNKKDG